MTLWLFLGVVLLIGMDIHVFHIANLNDIFKLIAADVVIFLLVVVPVSFIIAAIIGCFIPSHWQEDAVWNLASLRDQSSVSGNFFLGIGSIDEVQYYTYYVDHGNKQYSRDKIEVDDVLMINESDTIPPRLTRYVNVFNNPTYHLFAVDSLTERYEFTIPVGSIIKKFKLR